MLFISLIWKIINSQCESTMNFYVWHDPTWGSLYGLSKQVHNRYCSLSYTYVTEVRTVWSWLEHFSPQIFWVLLCCAKHEHFIHFYPIVLVKKLVIQCKSLYKTSNPFYYRHKHWNLCKLSWFQRCWIDGINVNLGRIWTPNRATGEISLSISSSVLAILSAHRLYCLKLVVCLNLYYMFISSFSFRWTDTLWSIAIWCPCNRVLLISN